MKPFGKAKLHALADQGLTLKDIGEELGTTVNGARSALRRVGRRAVHSMRQSIRQKAEGMKPTDAVEFLLHQLDVLTDGYASSGHHETDRFGLKLTYSQAKIFAALWDAAGEVVSKEALLSAMCFGSGGDEPAIRIIDVQICKRRRVIPAPIGEIVTVWGRGYSFIRGSDQ